MPNSLLRAVWVIYVSLNALITIIVSIIGVNYVRTAYQNIQISILENQKANHDIESAKPDEISKMNYVKLWLKVVWKLRSVYLSLFVHAFDVLTDLLVLTEWWRLENGDNDIKHINTRTMALCGIITLIVHKIVSTAAFWLKEKNVYRCIFQFFDLLIFEEIYICHKRVVTQFTNQQQSKCKVTDNSAINKTAVDTTTSFKYIRSLEAVFESIPQSVLQMVVIIRTGGQFYQTNGEYRVDLLVISYLSIFQSIVSMTNSIIKNDNIYMNTPQWKKHKQRLPPTMLFLKHALCRLCEIFYRIVLLALFWTICGGIAFSILLALEVLFIIILTFIEYRGKIGVQYMTIDEMFLRIQALVVLPSEMVFATDGTDPDANGITDCGFQDEVPWFWRQAIPGLVWTCFCCFWPAVLLTTLCKKRQTNHYVHPDFRIGVSMMEWIIVIIFAIFDDEERAFLFTFEHGLLMFIVGIVSYFVYSQYLVLSPIFVLPHDVGIRSLFGYAFTGELEELKRFTFEGSIQELLIEHSSINLKDEEVVDLVRNSLSDHVSILTYECTIAPVVVPLRLGIHFSMHINTMTWQRYHVLINKLQDLELALDQFYMNTKHSWGTNPWDRSAGHHAPCAIFAMANGHFDIVKWLEDKKGAMSHKSIFHDDQMSNMYKCQIMDETFARRHLDPYGKYY